MAERANIAASYRWRMLFVAVFCLLFATWFIYDGTIGYPAQAVRAKKYRELKGSGQDDWREQWEKLAVEKGWPTSDPGEPKVKADFIVQFMMAGIVTTVAIPFFFIFLSTRGRWIEMDEGGFTTSWGQRCELDDVYEFDKRKWYNKGIAVIRYDENGKQRRLVLDDCKYDRDPTELFVREVTLDLDEDQIVGGRAGEHLENDEQANAPEEGDADGDDDGVAAPVADASEKSDAELSKD